MARALVPAASRLFGAPAGRAQCRWRRKGCRGRRAGTHAKAFRAHTITGEVPIPAASRVHHLVWCAALALLVGLGKSRAGQSFSKLPPRHSCRRFLAAAEARRRALDPSAPAVPHGGDLPRVPGPRSPHHDDDGRGSDRDPSRCAWARDRGRGASLASQLLTLYITPVFYLCLERRGKALNTKTGIEDLVEQTV